MAARFLLDTNICICIQRQRPGNVLERFQKLEPGDVAVSVITWGELLYGAEKSKQRKKVLQLLAEFKTFVPVLPIPRGRREYIWSHPGITGIPWTAYG